jgi:polysaccharide biosynthesis/export protein
MQPSVISGGFLHSLERRDVNDYRICVEARFTATARGAYASLVHVAGMTEAEARTVPARRLGEYVRKPRIALRVQVYRRKPVYLDGDVHTLGVQIVNDVPMTLLEAIDRAGGLTTAADRSQVAVMRDGKTVNASLPAMLAAGVIPSGILLRDGDLVRVLATSDAKVFVPGEVPRPATMTLTDGR